MRQLRDVSAILGVIREMGFLSLLSGRAWVWGGGIIALAAFLVWGAVSLVHGTRDACEGRHAVAMAESIKRAEAQAREIALQDAEVLQSGETTRERIRTVYRERERKLAGMVPIDCNACRISDPAIGLLNDALSNGAAKPADPNTNALPRPGDPSAGGNHYRDFNSPIGRDRKVL